MKRKVVCVVATLIAIITVAGTFVGCKSAENQTIESLDDLNNPNYNIGMPTGTAAMFDTEARFPNAKKSYLTTPADCYLSLQTGKIDALSHDKSTLQYAVANGLEGVEIFPEAIGNPTNIAIGISRKSNVDNLQTNINNFLAELKADGTLDEAYDRWIIKGDDVMPEIAKPTSPKGTLRIGTCAVIPPFSYFKGTELNGFDIEIAKRLGSYLNMNVEFKNYNFTGAIAAAEAGAIDCIIANLNITEERKRVLDFSDPVYVSGTVLLMRKDMVGAPKPQLFTNLLTVNSDFLFTTTRVIHQKGYQILVQKLQL